jgi:uncharacterized membrane protein YsdA (DUF1294 family)/cold shock CspA family protein
MANQLKGTVATWKDDKGFGFIKPDDGGVEVFFHASGLINKRSNPAVNAIVTYTLNYDDKRGPRAVDVRFGDEPTSPIMMAFYVSGIFFVTLACMTFLTKITPLLAVFYVIMSGVTFIAYYIDKSKAGSGRRRIPESTLHLMELLGGWPGALVAQWSLRHKNRKISYQVVFWINVLLNLGALVWYFSTSFKW